MVHDGRRHSHGQRCWIRLRASVAGDAGWCSYTLQMFVRPILSLSIQMQRRESSRAPMQARAMPPASIKDRTGQGWSARARRRPKRACSLRQGTNIGTVCFNPLTSLLNLLIAHLVCRQPKVEKQSNGKSKPSTPVLVLQPGSFDSSSQ